MHVLTQAELEQILRERNYQEHDDQHGCAWLIHEATGRTISWEDDGRVARSTGRIKTTKARGDYWFVNRDPDLCQTYPGAVVWDGEIYLLTVASQRETEINAEANMRLLREMRSAENA